MTELQRFVEDGFLIEGTRDPHVALAAAIDDDTIDGWVEEIDWAQRVPSEADPEPERVRDLGDWCHQMISGATPGWWKWEDIPEDEQQDDDASRYLRSTEPGAKGAFEAVVFP